MYELILAILAFWIYLSLLSIGLQFIYGVARVLNLAHGAFFVLGGYLASAFVHWGLWYWPAVAAAAAVGLALGAAFYAAVARLLGNELYQLFFTFSLFWIAEGLFKLFFGFGLYNTYDEAKAMGLVRLGGAEMPAAYLAGAGVLALAVVGIYLLLYRTPLGLYIRATVDRPEMAAVLGVNTRLVYTVAVALGVSTALLGGAVSSLWQNFTIGLAGVLLVYAFAVVTVAGLGNVTGAVVAALLISVLRTLAVFYFPELELLVIYIAVIAVLLLKPSGLFTRYERRV